MSFFNRAYLLDNKNRKVECEKQSLYGQATMFMRGCKLACSPTSWVVKLGGVKASQGGANMRATYC